MRQVYNKNSIYQLDDRLFRYLYDSCSHSVFT